MLDGRKTYIFAAGVIVVSVLENTSYMDPGLANELIIFFLAGMGISLRHGMKTETRKASAIDNPEIEKDPGKLKELMEQSLTIPEAVRYYDIDYWELKKHIMNREIEAVRIKGSWRIPKKALKTYLLNRKQED